MSRIGDGRYWGGNAELHAFADKLQAIEFDHPFVLDGSTVMGRIFDATSFYAPCVTHDDQTDIRVDNATVEESEWSAITGATGQDSYNGAVMHSSEYIGSGLAERMSELSEEVPQVFVFVVCEVEASDDEIRLEARRLGVDANTDAGWDAARESADEKCEPAGWVILYRPAIPFRCMF